jgi:hypothetical protein
MEKSSISACTGEYHPGAYGWVFSSKKIMEVKYGFMFGLFGWIGAGYKCRGIK